MTLQENESLLKMIRNNAELVDRWTLHFDEVSNNVYKVELTDKFGRQSGTTDHDLDRAIETCIGHAFDIEKQLGNSLNKFTYDTFRYFLTDQNLLVENYSDKDFGSWTIENIKKRIILDGRDLLLTLQSQTETSNWEDNLTTKLTDLTFNQIKELKDKFKKDE